MLAIQNLLRIVGDRKLAVYGLGIQTEALLKELDAGRVLCLLDGYQTSGALYGVPVCPIEKAIGAGVQVIVAAARPESCKVIAKRVGELCRKNGVSLIDVEGRDLCGVPEARFDSPILGSVEKTALREAIDEADCVSVDIFDTLITRRTLFPSDVFDIVDARLRAQGIEIAQYANKRRDSERELMKNGEPSLREIYAHMVKACEISGVDAEYLADLEWKVDQALAVPRREVCELLEMVYAKGKPVYLVSDTYYTREQLVCLLEKCGMTAYTDILPSCEYGTSKTNLLFEKLKTKLRGRSCLHIGDSQTADVEGAQRAGIRAFKLCSGLELFEKAGYLGLWDHIRSLPDRIQAGMLVAKVFNSPFRRSPRDRLEIQTNFDIGYVLFAPVITEFVLWMRDRMREYGMKTVWFTARDGYLIKKLYDDLNGAADSLYFLTSRTAAIRAGMQTEEDLRYVEEMRFSGTLSELLEKRFGIRAGEDTPPMGSLMLFQKEIMERAAAERENVKTYLKGLPKPEGSIAFFDFVARGTVQMYTQRMLKNHLKGFYFMQQDIDRMGGLDVEAFTDGKNPVAKNYYILETVMTSPEPSVIGFDERGRPLYSEETRSAENMESVRQVQEGIERYFREYLEILPAACQRERELPGAILELVHKIEITAGEFWNLKVEDPFYNRTTSLADLV